MSTLIHHARTSSRHRLRRILAVGTATFAIVVASAAAASAHVRVVPSDTSADAWTTLTFRVPTESDTASTSKLEVALPTDTPLLSVSTKPVPGWTATVEEAPLPKPVEVEGTTLTKAPAKVTWTADADAAIAPGQFQEFEISAGPLPKEGTALSFPATQTYSDGTVVKWDQPTPADGTEPEHPVPAFTVTAASNDDAGTNAASDPDTLSRVLGAAGLALGVIAVVIAVLGRRRSNTTGSGAQ